MSVFRSRYNSKKKHKLNKSDLYFIKKTIKKFKCEDILKKFELI